MKFSPMSCTFSHPSINGPVRESRSKLRERKHVYRRSQTLLYADCDKENVQVNLPAPAQGKAGASAQDQLVLVEVLELFGRATDLICLGSPANCAEAVREMAEIKGKADLIKRELESGECGRTLSAESRNKAVRRIESCFLFSKFKLPSLGKQAELEASHREMGSLYQRVAATIEGRSPELAESEKKLAYELNLLREFAANLAIEEHSQMITQDKLKLLEAFRRDFEERQQSIEKEAHVASLHQETLDDGDGKVGATRNRHQGAGRGRSRGRHHAPARADRRQPDADPHERDQPLQVPQPRGPPRPRPRLFRERESPGRARRRDEGPDERRGRRHGHAPADRKRSRGCEK